MHRLTMVAIITLIAVRSEGQVAGPVGNSCAPTPDGLVSFYPGENSVTDVAGTSTGILVADTGYGAGKVNRAFSFDGLGDRIDLANAPAGTSFTIEAWVFLVGDNSGYRTIYVGSQAGFWLLNRQLNWWHGGDRFLGNTTIPTGSWHHAAMTYDGSTGSFTGYVDGVIDGSDIFVGSVLPNPAFVGGDSASEDLEGLIDELSIYNRVLTEVELQAIVAAGSAGKCLMFRGQFETNDTSRWSLSIP